MILKYKVLRPLKDGEGNTGLYHSWNWVGELTRVQGHGLDKDPVPNYEAFADCDVVYNEKPEVSEKMWQVYWLYRKDGKIAYLAFPTYTEAYLLADDGSTVDRVN